MRSDVALLFLLGASAWAAPGGNKCKKAVTSTNARTTSAVCNADNCLRAVRATSAKPFAASGTADCSSFMRKTVTPCAATSTSTKVVTVTGSPAYVTATAIVSQTVLNTVVQSGVTVVTTIEDTATFIQPTEVDVINIIVSAVTVTAAAVEKRSVEIRPLPTLPALSGAIDKRSASAATVRSATTTAPASTCPATTNAPNSVPTYASACSGTVRYSSACSCAGITAATTTLSQSTVISTTTSTSTYTPTATLTASITNQVPVTVTQTQLVPSTFETTDATLIIPSAFTITSDIIIPTTVVVSPPVCSSYQFVATNGPRSGQFLQGDTPDPRTVSYGFVDFTSDPASAGSFTLRADGTVYGGNNIYGWVTNSDSIYYILQMTDNSYQTYGSVRYVSCSIGSGDTAYPGAVGSVSCSTQGHPVSLVYCDQTDNDLLQTTEGDSGCSDAGLVAVPAC